MSSTDGWTLEVEDDWCRPSVTSGDDGDVVVLVVQPNDISITDRKQELIFKCGNQSVSCSIVQENKPNFFFDKDSIDIDFKEQSLIINVNTRVALEWFWSRRLSNSDIRPDVEGEWQKIPIEIKIPCNYSSNIKNYEVYLVKYYGAGVSEKQILSIKQGIADAPILQIDSRLHKAISDVGGIDENGDGYISKVEAADITSLDLTVQNDGDTEPQYVFNLKSDFPSLKSLRIRTKGELKDRISFPESEASLESLEVLYSNTVRIGGIRSKRVTIFNCPDLQDIDARADEDISISECNSLTSLSTYAEGSIVINECNNLVYASIGAPNVRILNCDRFKGSYPEGILYFLDGNIISSFEIRGCSSLQEINIQYWSSSGGPELATLTVSDCSSLQKITATASSEAKYSSLNNMNISGCAALALVDLEGLALRDINMTLDLDINECPALTRLYCGSMGLESLDVGDLTALEYLSCGNNQLSSLDLSNCTALESLFCSNNQLSSLDLSNCTALTSYLYCENNQLSSLDLSNCTALEYLSCSNNQLSSLDLSNCTALEYLSCSNNQLSSLDLSNCTALTDLSCVYNQLSILDLNNCAALKRIKCYNNNIKELKLDNLNVSTIDCSNNQLINLDLRNSPNLSKPSSFRGNKLEEIIFKRENNIDEDLFLSIISEYGYIIKYVD